MLRSHRILTLDVGASKIVLAEFQTARGAPPQLVRYGIGALGIDPENDYHSSAILVAGLRDLMREQGIKPAPLYMSISGQTVFPRYVKLPPVAADKLVQMIRYEAEQNVPFPINEVVWDYQLLSGGGDQDTHVILVAVKVENVTRLTDCVQATGLEPRVVDAAPMALYNAFRCNYPRVEGCTMLLDIGARSSNLVFVEGHRVFTRSVPVAGNAITQEIAKQFNIPFEEAEEVKKAHAQVDLGGNYEGPEGDVAQQVAKIVRTVMTRLHAEVNRSINFYRSQQGGGAPERVLLSGGSSIMPYTDVFFRDKLKVEVEYLNPFAAIPVAPGIPEDQIAKDVHLMGEAVGLALRHEAECPIEINLMPPDLVALKTFRRRQPFFAAAALGVILTLLTLYGLSRHTHRLKQAQLDGLNRRLSELATVQQDLQVAMAEKRKAQADVDAVAAVVASRSQWLDLLNTLHACLLDGMWLTGIAPVTGADGRVTHLDVRGMGFEDKLRRYDDSREATSIEQFRNRIREAGRAFTTQAEITEQPPPAPGDPIRKFALRLELAPVEAGLTP